MKTIEKATISEIVKEIKTSARNYADVRNIINARINPCDVIPAQYAEIMLKVVKLSYNPADYGRKGKYAEAVDRIELLTMNGAEAIPFREFFAHRQGKTDIYDAVERTCYEKKTGTGDWLYCESGDFDECIELYRRKRTKIRWDYERADKGINIHIECSYRELFDYLTAYNPDKGLATWFIKSSRSEAVWKMQEIATSKKKIAYLNGWGK